MLNQHINRSSLHCNISLSFCSFSYNEVYFDGIKLSVNDVIDSQKGSNGNGKLKFNGRDYNFTCTLCAKLRLWAKMLLKMSAHFDHGTYSNVQKGHKIKQKWTNGDYCSPWFKFSTFLRLFILWNSGCNTTRKWLDNHILNN